jgi:hypothetical protein
MINGSDEQCQTSMAHSWQLAVMTRCGAGHDNPKDCAQPLCVCVTQSIRLWDIESGKCLEAQTMSGHEHVIETVMWLPPAAVNTVTAADEFVEQVCRADFCSNI